MAIFSVFWGFGGYPHFEPFLDRFGLFRGISGYIRDSSREVGTYIGIWGVYTRDLFWTGVPIPEMGILHENRFESVVPILFPNLVSESGPDPAREISPGRRGRTRGISHPGGPSPAPPSRTHGIPEHRSAVSPRARVLEPAGSQFFLVYVGTKIGTTL